MLQDIRLEELAPSPTNPRKTFDDAKLEELARSIASVGVLEPLIVRAHQNGEGVRYEIVAGERRFRAATLAQIETVPCMVRELDDVQVLEIQAIENLQRDDVHPLEEAEGYAALMKAAGYDVDEIAAKIGRSGRYVYDRIKLLQLIPAVRKVFVDGEITAGHAILLARLSKADQKRALGDPNEPWDSGVFQEDYDDDEPELELGAPIKRIAKTVRQLDRWIRDEVRLQPGADDFPELFPETAVALTAAAETKLEVVHVTHEWRVTDDGGPKIYTEHDWKRADGQGDEWANPTKECDASVLGVIVLGRDQGQAFKVCVDKKCSVHWKEERASSSGGGSGSRLKDHGAAAQEKKWAEQRKREAAERERWKKALPKIREAVVAKLQATPAKDLLDLVIEGCAGYGGIKRTKEMARGKTVDDGVRFAAYLVLLDDALGEYSDRQGPTQLKKIGVDAKKIIDAAAPKPKPEKKPKTEASAKATAKKPGARARRRAKKAKTSAKGG